MDKRYYTADTLEAELREFEQRFGVRSDEFYVAAMRDEAPESVDPFDRFLWLQTYRDACRLRGGDAATAALQPAS